MEREGTESKGEITFHSTTVAVCCHCVFEIAMFSMTENRQIPPALNKFFWDADFAQLKLPDHENYVLGKLMLYGDIASIKWILLTFDHGTVSRYLETKGKYALDRRSYLFWEKVLRMGDLWH